MSHGGSPSLLARIDAEVRERIEEAVDAACLDAMVKARAAAGLPPPAADDARDRREYEDRVREFLERLRGDLLPAVAGDIRRRITTMDGQAGEPVAGLLAVQVALAKELPDYWQRFDAIRVAYAAGERADSRSESRRLLDRVFRRG